jgi:hypothetical protein
MLQGSERPAWFGSHYVKIGPETIVVKPVVPAALVRHSKDAGALGLLPVTGSAYEL